MRFLPAWAPALLLLLCACGGGSNGNPLEPPGRFAVTSNPAMDFDTLYFSWVPATGQVDGYNLQGALNGGTFEQLNSTPIPRDSVGASLALYPSLPEQSAFVFRINSVMGSNKSDWAQASYLRGIRPPQSFYAMQEAAQSRIHLSWTPRSLVADRITVKRTARSLTGGTPVTRTLATLDPAATSYDDTDLQEGASYEYRLTSDKGSASSAEVSSGDVYYALNGPAGLTVQTGTDSATLSWTLSSVRTTAIRVYRTTLAAGTPSPTANVPLAVLDPAARGFTDTGLAPGLYSYRVCSYLEAGNNEATSALVTVCTQPAPLGGQTFQAKWLPLPGAPWIQPDGQDRWLCWPAPLGAQSYGLVTWTPTGTTRQAYSSTQGPASTPPMVMDTTARPHMALVDGLNQLVHVWETGSGWQTEVVAQDAYSITSLGYEGLPLLVGPDGSLRLLFANRYNGKTFEAIRGAAGWTVTEVPQLARMSGFALDAAGTLWGLELGWNGPEVPRPLILWNRGLDGSWASQPVPGSGTLSAVAFALGNDGGIHLVFLKPADADGPQALVHVARQGPAWSRPEVLASEGPNAGYVQYLSVSPQDQRLFYSADRQEGTVLFTRGPEGTWSRSTLFPAGYTPHYFIQGRTGDGKVFLALWVPTGYQDGVVVFSQP